jgi:hypothetical protein
LGGDKYVAQVAESFAAASPEAPRREMSVLFGERRQQPVYRAVTRSAAAALTAGAASAPPSPGTAPEYMPEPTAPPVAASTGQQPALIAAALFLAALVGVVHAADEQRWPRAYRHQVDPRHYRSERCTPPARARPLRRRWTSRHKLTGR